MDKKEYTDLIESWIKFQNSEEESSLREELDWADYKMWQLTLHDPDLAWFLILEILKKDNTGKIMENLSAGPLEDLLSRHGKRLIEFVEEEAKHNEQFRILLGGIWQNDIPDEIWERIKAVAGPSW